MNACPVNFRCFLHLETTATAQHVVQMFGTDCYKATYCEFLVGTFHQNFYFDFYAM